MTSFESELVPVTEADVEQRLSPAEVEALKARFEDAEFREKVAATAAIEQTRVQYGDRKDDNAVYGTGRYAIQNSQILAQISEAPVWPEQYYPEYWQAIVGQMEALELDG